MGQHQSKQFQLSKSDISDSEQILEHFTKNEKKYLEASFKDLAKRSPGPTIDRATFLKTFSLPGLYGEQLFNVFDFKHTGNIDYLEFLTGLALCLKGNPDEKLEILFQIFDISSDGKITKQELETMLLQVPTKSIKSIVESDYPAEELLHKQEIVAKVVENIFSKFDKDKSENLSPDEFREWVKSTPQVVQLLDSVFNVVASSPVASPLEEIAAKHSKSMPLAKSRSDSTPSNDSSKSLSSHVKHMFNGTRLHLLHRRKRAGEHNHSAPGLGISRNHSDDVLPGSQPDDSAGLQILKEGEMKKIGSITKILVQRYFILKGNLLCYYANKHKAETDLPRGVILLSGCFIDPIEKGDQKVRGTHPYGFEVRLPYNAEHETVEQVEEAKEREKDLKKVFFCKTENQRNDWIQALRLASKDRKFDQFFEKQEMIGAGKFASVFRCVSKDQGSNSQNDVFAVKLLKKDYISPQERELLRTEIAILRLVEHDNVVRLVDVFEDQTNLYIVTELVTGGELFEYISGRSRFSEEEAYILLSQLLDGIDYLHSAGIMHRDIKPENILLQWIAADEDHKKQLHTSTKVKLTDFGLSQLVHPKQILDMPCGTISYVAPEVLESKGYDVSADLWSIGVIMFLVLRGKLPFDGEGTSEIRNQMQDHAMEIDNLFKDKIWENHDPELIELMKVMLHPDPKARKTAAEIKSHPWMTKLAAKLEVKEE